MPKELLTARGLESAIRAAQTEAAAKNTRVKVRDGNNLMLIVRPTGGASWVLQYRSGGARKPLTLGSWPAVPLKLARELADQARTSLARGIDPGEQRQQLRSEARQARQQTGYTVRRLFEEWQAKQTVSDVYRGNIEAAMVKDVLPAIGARHPKDVTRADIIAVLRELEKRRALVMLRRLRMWLKQMFEFAIDAEIAPASPVPTGHLKSFLSPTPKHFPALTRPEDVPKLMRAIREYPQPVARMALLLSAYVWQRPSEVREAVWTEFDLDAAVWTIPAARMKMDREHLVPLAPQVVALLQQLQGIVGNKGYLFPGWRYGKPLSEGTLGKALDAMGFAGRHTPHGFRAMARTILEEHLGADPRYLEKQLAHEEPDKVRRAYSRTQFMPERRAVMIQWADWLDAQR